MARNANSNAAPVVAVEPQANATSATNNVADVAVTYHNIIKKLMASGAKRINSVQIKNVNATDKDNYTMVSFTLTTKVPGPVRDEATDSWSMGLTNTIYTSLYAIVGAIKEDENLSWLGSALLERPAALGLIFAGAKIDILQQEFAQGEEIVNPFSTRDDAEARVYDHDTIINNIIGFNLGTTGARMADKLADKLLGF